MNNSEIQVPVESEVSGDCIKIDELSTPKENAASEEEKINDEPEEFSKEEAVAEEIADDIENEEELPDCDADLILTDTELIKCDEVNKTYNNIMNVCSTAAEAIKKTIVEVLNTRAENTSVVANDSASELEASLKEKIADFENVVNVCCPISNNETDIDQRKTSDGDNSQDAKNIKQDSENNVNSSLQNTVSKDTIEEPKKQTVQETKVNVSSKTKSVTTQETAKVTINAEDERALKKQQKSSSKRKGEKTVDQVLKSLGNNLTTEEKLLTLSKKHLDVLDELRAIEPRLKLCDRQVITLNREKELLQAEHNRTILAKSRLESLCRELQRQNKAVKEESLLRIREEEEKRKEVANKFQSTLNDISALMQENSKKNIQLREENAELATKLKGLVDHYEMWEKHMEKVVQQKDLEAQLAKAKHAKINLLLKQETEKFLREKHYLLENMSELQKKCTTLASNELQLRTELGDYTSKYEEFQTVLNKSSQVFASFKTDMEMTSKKIKKLEKETNIYKHKWESSNNALLNMISDKQKSDKDLCNAHQRVLTLEKLCRALQAERNELQVQINAHLSAGQTENEVPTTEISTVQ